MGGAIGPERPRCIPEGGQSLAIGIAVLADNSLDPLRMFNCQAKSHGGSIILDIDAEALEPERVENFFYHLFQVIERIGELLDTWTIAIAVPRIIWCHHMEVFGECRKQVAKHMGRRRKPVQQNERACMLFSCLTIKHLDAVNQHRSVRDGCHSGPPLRGTAVLTTTAPLIHDELGLQTYITWLA